MCKVYSTHVIENYVICTMISTFILEPSAQLCFDHFAHVKLYLMKVKLLGTSYVCTKYSHTCVSDIVLLTYTKHWFSYLYMVS